MKSSVKSFLLLGTVSDVFIFFALVEDRVIIVAERNQKLLGNPIVSPLSYFKDLCCPSNVEEDPDEILESRLFLSQNGLAMCFSNASENQIVLSLNKIGNKARKKLALPLLPKINGNQARKRFALSIRRNLEIATA